MDIVKSVNSRSENNEDKASTYLSRGTAAFRRAYIGLFLAGFATFAVLYDIQPLMPALATQFNLTPAAASLSLSVTTAALSVMLVLVGSLSEALGRKKIMAISIVVSSILAVMVAFSPNYNILLTLRILQGIVLAGLPAVAMAYLGEEIHPGSLGYAMGLYISGNTIGGISGRIIAGTLTDISSWRIALGVIGGISLIASLVFCWALPPSRRFQPSALNMRSLIASLVNNLRDRGLLLLFATGALLMGSFVTMYNFTSFRLITAPFYLSQTLVGWIFIVYLAGTFSSTWMGNLADRIGRRKVLLASVLLMLTGVGLTAFENLIIIIVGLIIFTFGFFGGHSIASSWVGRRALTARAQASSLYLFFYYMGGSLFGYCGGYMWLQYHWAGIVAMISSLLIIAFLIAVLLYKVPPISANTRIS